MARAAEQVLFAIQIAKLHGVEVTGVDRPGKLDFMRSVGFDKVIDYTQQDFTRNGTSYDLIFETNRSPFDYARALSPKSFNHFGLAVHAAGSLQLVGFGDLPDLFRQGTLIAP